MRQSGQVGESVGELRIGAMETFAALHLPTALKAVRADHSGIEFTGFITDTTAHLMDKVLSHQTGLRLCRGAGRASGPGFRANWWFEELVQVCARGASPGAPAIDSFPRRLCLPGEGNGLATHDWVMPWADAMEFGTLEGILGCVSVGLGWTLMPRRVVEKSLHAADLVVESLPADIANVPTGMIVLREGSLMPALKTLSPGGLLQSAL